MKKYIIIYTHARRYDRESEYCAVLNEDKSLKLFILEEAKRCTKGLVDKYKIVEI